ncbi:MAG: hypothetical protein VKI81_12515, partial [Synechococcaceae cyanobacterium]|nr:hypothetical protein [Synechococcaceae cyanobacterium]
NPDAPNPLIVDGYLPRFWVAGNWEVIEDRAAIPARLADPAFDVASTVLLEEDPGLARNPAGGEPGTVWSYAYDGNRIRIDVEADRDCLLVHSENWFPYWRVFEGDRELPILRANGAIRAIPLSPGRHELEFRYRSPPYVLGRAITGFTLLVVIGTAVLLRVRSRGRAPA